MGLIKYIFKETDSTLNNAIKAGWIAFLVAVICFYAFAVDTVTYRPGTGLIKMLFPTTTTEYGLTEAIIAFVVVFLGLFLKYNNKKE
jgi:hypothetical protein